MRWLLLWLLLVGIARAEDPGPHWIAVLEPGSGKLLAHYRVDAAVRAQIAHGTEEPHFAYLKQFLEPATSPDKPVYHDHADCLGRLDSGACLLFRRKDDQEWNGLGDLGVLDAKGQFRLLEAGVTRWSGGRSSGFSNPRVVLAENYLLTDHGSGVTCRLLPEGRQLWKADWRLGHSRWYWGAWLLEGALFVDTRQGLSRVDPATGKRQWTYAGAGEVTEIRRSPDGKLYVDFIYPPFTLDRELGRAAVKRYGWLAGKIAGYDPEQEFTARDQTEFFKFGLVVIPYRTSYFGFTYNGPQEDGQFDYQTGTGKAAVWEYRPHGWSFIFEYTPAQLSLKEKTALYARNGFSDLMRRRLTADFPD